MCKAAAPSAAAAMGFGPVPVLHVMRAVCKECRMVGQAWQVQEQPVSLSACTAFRPPPSAEPAALRPSFHSRATVACRKPGETTFMACCLPSLCAGNKGSIGSRTGEEPLTCMQWELFLLATVGAGLPIACQYLTHVAARQSFVRRQAKLACPLGTSRGVCDSAYSPGAREVASQSALIAACEPARAVMTTGYVRPDDPASMHVCTKARHCFPDHTGRHACLCRQASSRACGQHMGRQTWPLHSCLHCPCSRWAHQQPRPAAGTAGERAATRVQVPKVSTLPC